MHAYEALNNKDFPVKLTELGHKSVGKRPVMIVHPGQILPLPLHVTLLFTALMLKLAIEIALAEWAHEKGRKCAPGLRIALLQDVGVAPAPAHGGTFASNECHTTSKKNAVIIALLAKYDASRVALEAYTKVWRLWSRIRPALNAASI